MTIGIPRSLFYYYYKDLWINFFSYLNIKIIISPKTNKEIIDLGNMYSSDEMCFSIKNYIGHVAYLRDKCDYILVPRIDNYGLTNQTCTNFLSAYDIVNNLFDINILNYNVNLLNNEKEIDGMIKIGKILNIDKNKIVDAYNYSIKISKDIKDREILNNIEKLNSKNIKILLVSHDYNTFDECMGVPIIKILKKNNVEVINSTLFDTNNINPYCKDLYWKYSKEQTNSINLCIDKVDGIIFLSSFPCGLDSLVNEIIMRKISIPYINIVIDDVSIMGGIETRIESFIDIIKVNK